jgi:putative restriction endonuclease
MSESMSVPPIDHRIRVAAFDWLRKQFAAKGEEFTRDELYRGFDYEGERVPLVAPNGIFKPRRCTYPLTITTIINGPYDDRVSGDGGLLEYRYRGTDPMHVDNRGLRAAMTDQIPLIYLVGMGGWYSVYWPVFIVDDNPRALSFTVALDDQQVVAPRAEWRIDAFDSETRRRYATYVAKRRLHQQSFRDMVLHAYKGQCSICQLRHRPLLDAAHIVADADPDGIAAVRNGLALCKLHHSAYDASILGVTPGYVVKIREDVLVEIDGPLLEHGLKELHDSKLVLPRATEHKPDRDLLARRYETFLQR